MNTLMKLTARASGAVDTRCDLQRDGERFRGGPDCSPFTLCNEHITSTVANHILQLLTVV